MGAKTKKQQTKTRTKQVGLEVPGALFRDLDQWVEELNQRAGNGARHSRESLMKDLLRCAVKDMGFDAHIEAYRKPSRPYVVGSLRLLSSLSEILDLWAGTISARREKRWSKKDLILFVLCRALEERNHNAVLQNGCQPTPAPPQSEEIADIKRRVTTLESLALSSESRAHASSGRDVWVETPGWVFGASSGSWTTWTQEKKIQVLGEVLAKYGHSDDVADAVSRVDAQAALVLRMNALSAVRFS